MEKAQILQHLAVIMDGNARWAKAHNLPKIEGHRKGAEALRKILKPCIEFGIKYLSVYAFSEENWERPANEVNDLMKLLDFYIKHETKSLIKNDIKLHISGDLSKLSDSSRHAVINAIDKTKNCKNLTLNVCFSYGARQEITQAYKNMLSNNIQANEVNENIIKQYLYTKNIPDPDFLIRTAGEKRISNFLLWQIAYTELYFTDILWPDFNEKHLQIAMNEFANRERRYGKR